MQQENSLLKLREVSITHGQQALVKRVSFTLNAGQTLGIVGESGSGKSLCSLAIMGLLPANLTLTGAIEFKGENLLKATAEKRRKLRGAAMSMIFQEPMSALNPTMTCGRQVAEILHQHQQLSAKEANAEVQRLFTEVELPRAGQMMKQYPHQLSGGQRQRVMIAMAIACRPQLLIADEPTTALDAAVQQEIMVLLQKLSTEYGMALIFISHDLNVVQRMAQRILVMRHGAVIEQGSKEKISQKAQEPYTRGLWACRPQPDKRYRRLPLISDFMEGKPLPPQEPRPAFPLENRPDLLRISDLDKVFPTHPPVQALEAISLTLYQGESLGLVGESGSGKSTLGRILTGLETVTAGAVHYKGKDIAHAGARQWRALHREIQIIFQDPFSSLNPRLRVGEAIAEVLQQRRGMQRGEAQKQTALLLERVGLEAAAAHKYPHAFSGGQRQRIGIARALAVQPEFIVCDESVSALDVSVQAQILNLLNDLKEEFGFTYLFISHDLPVVQYFCDRIVVLQNGRIVEIGAAEQLYRNPKKEYTRKLIAAAE